MTQCHVVQGLRKYYRCKGPLIYSFPQYNVFLALSAVNVFVSVHISIYIVYTWLCFSAFDDADLITGDSVRDTLYWGPRLLGGLNKPA